MLELSEEESFDDVVDVVKVNVVIEFIVIERRLLTWKRKIRFDEGVVKVHIISLFCER